MDEGLPAALAGSLESVAPSLPGLNAVGRRIASQDPNTQTAEVCTRIALMNPFDALGTAGIRRVA